MSLMSIDLCNESGISVNEEELLAQAQFMLHQLRIHPASELSIMLVDEIEMADLHERYMDEPGSTDVLSFPMDELREGSPGQLSKEGMLGDIVICPEVAIRQAQVAGHPADAEMRLLLTHGLLHLLGHDHAEPAEHAIMFRLQDQLLEAWASHKDSETTP